MNEQENAGTSMSVETINFKSQVQMTGDLKDVLFNWLVLTNSICITFDLPIDLLAVAMPSGVEMVQSATGSTTLAKIDLDSVLGGGRQ